MAAGAYVIAADELAKKAKITGAAVGQVAYEGVANKVKEGYDSAKGAVETGKNTLVDAGEAVANKASEKYNVLEQRATDAYGKMENRYTTAKEALIAKMEAFKKDRLMQDYEAKRKQRDMLEDRMQAIIDQMEDIHLPRTATGSLPALE